MLQTLKTHFSYRWLAFLLIPAVILIAFFSANHFTNQAHAASSSSRAVHAASPCSGSLISTNSITSNRAEIGELDVYYDSSTGKNCAITQSGNQSWGVRKSMTVFLSICQQAGPGWGCNPSVFDSGNYSYYAGPVSLSARGQCIEATGSIQWNGVRYWANVGPSFCGG